MKNFFEGLAYNFKGFEVFSTQKGLWRFVLIPLILNILILILVSAIYIHFFNEILDFLSAPVNALDVLDPSGIWDYMVDGFYWILRGIFRLLVFLFSLLLLFVLIYVLGSLVNAPFYEFLSEKILIAKGLRKNMPFQWQRFKEEWLHAMKVELFKFLVLGVPLTLIGILAWIPVVGVVFTFLSFLFISWYFALGIVSYPMVLLRKDFKEILRFGRKNKSLLMGFGLPVLLPVIGIFLVSFQIVGGTVMYIERSESS